MNKHGVITAIVLMMTCIAPAFSASTSTTVIYVNAAHTAGLADGKSWETAYPSLITALNAVQSGQEIWVAKGVYKPTNINTDTNRDATFQLKSGVALYGGFSGVETKRDSRNWKKNPTVLSGHLGNDTYAYHVVMGQSNAILDGFTITDGCADGEIYRGMGGGMLNLINQSPTVRHCLFIKNSAIVGGAMYNYHHSSPTIEDSQFNNNRAQYGGAILNRDGASPAIQRTDFSDNNAQYNGGAVYIDYGSSPVFKDCQFTNNRAEGNGGAIYDTDRASQIGLTKPEIYHSTFTNNSAKFYGGAIENFDKVKTVISGCHFISNSAGKSGGAISNRYYVDVQINDCQYERNLAPGGSANIYTDDTALG